MENWKKNHIQFPRLISELQMVGAFTRPVMEKLCESMDLSAEDILEIVGRADVQWDKIKNKAMGGN